MQYGRLLMTCKVSVGVERFVIISRNVRSTIRGRVRRPFEPASLSEIDEFHLLQLIHIRHSISSAIRVARCFGISNRSLYCLKHSVMKLYLLFYKLNKDPIAGTAVIRFSLRLSILHDSKKSILTTVNFYIKSSQICKIIHFYKVTVKVTASLGPILKHFTSLSDLIAMNTGIAR